MDRETHKEIHDWATQIERIHPAFAQRGGKRLAEWIECQPWGSTTYEQIFLQAARIVDEQRAGSVRYMKGQKPR